MKQEKIIRSLSVVPRILITMFVIAPGLWLNAAFAAEVIFIDGRFVGQTPIWELHGEKINPINIKVKVGDVLVFRHGSTSFGAKHGITFTDTPVPVRLCDVVEDKPEQVLVEIPAYCETTGDDSRHKKKFNPGDIDNPKPFAVFQVVKSFNQQIKFHCTVHEEKMKGTISMD